MPLHVYSFTNLETNKWNQQSMLWRNSKECVVSENSCSRNFVNFQEKRPGEIAFLNKVTGYLTLTGNVRLGNLWNFQNKKHKTFTRNTREWWLLQLVVIGKCYDQNIFFKIFRLFFIYSKYISMYKDFDNLKTYFKSLISGKIII